MSKDKYSGGFNGLYKHWYLNGGEGSYKESNYGEGETDKLTFGFTKG